MKKRQLHTCTPGAMRWQCTSDAAACAHKNNQKRCHDHQGLPGAKQANVSTAYLRGCGALSWARGSKGWRHACPAQQSARAHACVCARAVCVCALCVYVCMFPSAREGVIEPARLRCSELGTRLQGLAPRMSSAAICACTCVCVCVRFVCVCNVFVCACMRAPDAGARPLRAGGSQHTQPHMPSHPCSLQPHTCAHTPSTHIHKPCTHTSRAHPVPCSMSAVVRGKMRTPYTHIHTPQIRMHTHTHTSRARPAPCSTSAVKRGEMRRALGGEARPPCLPLAAGTRLSTRAAL